MNNRATVKIDLDAKNKDVESKLLILRVTYHRRNRQYSIGETIHLTKKEFKGRSKKSLEAMDIAQKAFLIAQKVIQELGTDFSFDSFKERYKSRLTGNNPVSSSFESLLTDYFEHHKLAYKTKKSYETSVNWVIRYRKNVTLSAITPEFVEGLISYMEQEHLKEHKSEMSKNTRNIYLRQLRAIYNFAIEHGYTSNKNPFAIKNLGSIKRQKAALTVEELKQFLEYTPKNKEEEIGKDFFLLSLHCSGANLGDILLFRNSNIENGTITFVRKKTQKTNIEIQFQLTDVAKELLNKYGKISETDPNALILPYLANATSERNYENIIKRIIRKVNAGLKSISETLGLRRVTTYTARHTYATLLMLNGMTTEHIQKFLGHSSSTTTQTYLGGLSTSILDTNKNILENLGSMK